ncbi:MAG: HAD family hydrolase [Thermoguttaceae bacterium]|nr:HAD family hydrolase [Thermoguttaceae bacterium]MDW8037144.1 HAD family hydrolase [Thermoguttaceae bacterium]
MAASGAVDWQAIQRGDPARLVVETEARANPFWPMPGALEAVGRLRQAGYVLGIVSNAQFYTPSLFPALFGRRAEELGFNPKRIFYSYAHGMAKPSVRFFQLAQHAPVQCHIAAAQTLHLGNDMLHDIWPAPQIGFRAVLFADDGRTLRLRTDQSQLQNLRPDVAVSSLTELAHWLTSPP